MNLQNYTFKITAVSQRGWWQVNSLRPSDAIWRHPSGSTLAQVMACCLMAPSHYLNQCWLLISKVQWQITMKITYLKFISYMPGANELTHFFFTYLLYIHDFVVRDETTAMAGITFPLHVPWQWWDGHSGRMGISQGQVLTGLLQSMEPVKKRYGQIDGLVQERRNSSVLAMELRLSCTKPSRWCETPKGL